MPNSPRIELPRPAIIAALGALLLVLTFVVTKGSETGSGSGANNPAADTSTTTTPSGSSTSTGTTAPTTKKAAPEQPKVTASPGLPSDVARALDAGKVVVLFFYEPAGADDQATRAAVRTARTAAGNRVRVFQDVVAHISDYRRVTGSLGIAQSPAMVVIDKKRNARIFEGYLDSGTIRQTVRDAL